MYQVRKLNPFRNAALEKADTALSFDHSLRSINRILSPRCNESCVSLELRSGRWNNPVWVSGRPIPFDHSNAHLLLRLCNISASFLGTCQFPSSSLDILSRIWSLCRWLHRFVHGMQPRSAETRRAGGDWSFDGYLGGRKGDWICC